MTAVKAESRQDLLNQRQYLLGLVATIEGRLDEPLTTSKMRQWFKRFGPTPEEALAELEAGK